MRLHVVVRRDEDDYYVATVPELPGCYTQAKSLDDLMSRSRRPFHFIWRRKAAAPLEALWECMLLKLRPFEARVVIKVL